MSITYTFNSTEYSDDFIGQSLRTLLLDFETNGAAGEHDDNNPGGINTGGFYNNGVASGLSGDTYSQANGEGFAFSAYGSLSYNFSAHSLTGTVESISLGSYLNTDGTVGDPFITFNFDDLTSGSETGRDNAVHDVIWGLMNGSVQGAEDSAGTVNDGGLLALLDAAGISSDILTSGSSSFTESELLLAA
ncbi:heme acquisition protein HasA [Pseudomonas sp. LRF_L74]|uniref:heme acquisition protein HasA n=1 Tax=Pseudomonas sp. LRF_L74 TaxID=3369422 RepID=UPI003F60EBF9